MRPEEPELPALLAPAELPALPENTRRLFAHYEPGGLDLRRHRLFLIARLLEDGDGADLAWLARAVPEAELAAWLAGRGGRQLSARSRAYWRIVLGVETPGGLSSPELWPL